MSKFKVGDTVECKVDYPVSDVQSGTLYTVTAQGDGWIEVWSDTHEKETCDPEDFEVALSGKEEDTDLKSDGGPSSYYDYPTSWCTLNDYIEHKSEHQWKRFSFHLANIEKAMCRWGDKAGTTIEYDARKIIYSGCRVLKMIVGVSAMRGYLQMLLDDPQFKTPE